MTAKTALVTNTLSNKALVILGQANPTLKVHVQANRMLKERVANGIVEIGRRLTECREIVGHGSWAAWLKTHFDWSDRTALNFMRVFEMINSETISDLDQINLPTTALYVLAAPSTPETARAEILDRAKAGEKFTVESVKDEVAEAKDEVAEKAKPNPEVEPKTEPPTKAKKKSKSTSVNPKPLPDIADKCVDAVRRRVEDTVLEIRNHHSAAGSKLERLFAALTDVVEDIRRKSLVEDESAEASAQKRKADYAALEAPQ
jgi:hypothetical protein